MGLLALGALYAIWGWGFTGYAAQAERQHTEITCAYIGGAKPKAKQASQAPETLVCKGDAYPDASDASTTQQAEQTGFLPMSKALARKLVSDPVAMFTLVLAIFTIGLFLVGRDQNRTAVAATEAIPILERAYVYTNMIGSNLRDLVRSSETELPPTVQPNQGPHQVNISFEIRNYGKTPARLLSGEVEIHLVPPTADVQAPTDWVIPERHILGHTECTQPIRREYMPGLTNQQLRAVKSGGLSVLLVGWITYLDIWNVRQTCKVAWRYNPTLERFTPEVRRLNAGKHNDEKPS
jgi:hypothetical protein